MDYLKQAEDFMKAADAELTVKLLYHGPYFDDDKEYRDVYEFTLTTPRGSYTTKFGASIRDTFIRQNAGKMLAWPDIQKARRMGIKVRESGNFGMISKSENNWHEPNAYDILAALTKSEPGTFSEFCAEYGYSENKLSEYPKVTKIYDAIAAEYRSVKRLFTHEQLEQLAEIN